MRKKMMAALMTHMVSTLTSFSLTAPMSRSTSVGLCAKMCAAKGPDAADASVVAMRAAHASRSCCSDSDNGGGGGVQSAALADVLTPASWQQSPPSPVSQRPPAQQQLPLSPPPPPPLLLPLLSPLVSTLLSPLEPPLLPRLASALALAAGSSPRSLSALQPRRGDASALSVSTTHWMKMEASTMCELRRSMKRRTRCSPELPDASCACTRLRSGKLNLSISASKSKKTCSWGSGGVSSQSSCCSTKSMKPGKRATSCCSLTELACTHLCTHEASPSR
mmetsp:Transcript_33148/g.63871  ORF Transcript_33148/g.63871 Transcript_33148/m.63871 type:complete len:278 (+) Transcript_33148:931-1764(+)